jgi:iron complex outermembrane receptor protein
MVRLPTQEPAADAVVELRELPDHRGKTDTAGAFLLTDIPAGSYVLVASKDQYNPGTLSVTIPAGDTITVTITLSAPVQLAEIAVTGTTPGAYTSDTAIAGAKIPVPIRDLPQTVTVVTEGVISDRNLTSLSRLADNVSSVAPLVGYDGYGLNEQGYIIRGFATSYTSTSLRDGFRDFAGVTPRDLASVERVEFLKGPSSVLYGATGALGGLPNTVTKKPTPNRITGVEASADGNGLIRGTVDLGGPVNADSSVRFRLIGAGERSQNFRSFDNGAYGLSIVPSLEYRRGPTLVRLSGEYTRRRYRPDPYLPLDPVSFSLPVDRFLGEPAMPLADAQGFVAQLAVEHRFRDGVNFRQGLSVLGGRLPHTSPGLSSYDSLTGLVNRYSSYTDERSTDLASQTELRLSGRRFGVHHTLLLGVELSREVYSVLFTNDGLAPISVTNPVYGAQPTPGDTVTASHPENQLGVYLQDLIAIGPHLKAMVGARFDANHTEQSVEWAALGLTGVVAEQTTHHVTPRAGLVYQPNQDWSFYAGWSQSFFPNLSLRGVDPTFPPERGEQFEGGVRFERRGFSATGAAYQITKHNVLEPIPSDSLGRSALSAAQRSRGVELDVQGSPLPGWKLIAAYAYTDAKQTESVDSTLPVGGQLAGVPRHSGSLWTTYEVERGALHGLSIGGGVYAWTEHEATFPHTVRVSGWQRLDLLLAYEVSGYRFQLNVVNVTDEKYFLGNSVGLAPQAPRTFIGSITARF